MNDFPTSEPQLDPVNSVKPEGPAASDEPVGLDEQLEPVTLAADASPTPVSPSPSSAEEPSFNTRHFLTPFIAVAAWIVPGLGHLLVGRWGRAALIFLCVGGLALTGFYARGQVFPPHSDDPFGTLGFLADACSGVFFVIAHLIERAGPDVSRAAGDYGTRFVAAAGLVNLLAVLDACGIALGRRN